MKVLSYLPARCRCGQKDFVFYLDTELVVVKFWNRRMFFSFIQVRIKRIMLFL